MADRSPEHGDDQARERRRLRYPERTRPFDDVDAAAVTLAEALSSSLYSRRSLTYDDDSHRRQAGVNDIDEDLIRSGPCDRQSRRRRVRAH